MAWFAAVTVKVCFLRAALSLSSQRCKMKVAAAKAARICVHAGDEIETAYYPSAWPPQMWGPGLMAASPN